MATYVWQLQVGTLTFGVWCDRCLLPAAWTAPLTMIEDDGVRNVGAVTQCTNCDPLDGDD